MHANPYATESLSLPVEQSVATDRKLFTPNHVALAAFLGAPLAGAVVLAINFARLGRTSAAWASVALGAAASGVLLSMALMLELPTGVGGLLGIGYALAMRAIAQRLQGEDIGRHVANQGALASGWTAAGIAVASFLLQFALLVAALIAFAL